MRIPRWAVGIVAVIASTLAAPSPAVSATPSPDTDSFYTYTDSKPLSEIAPGTVLKTRTGTTTFPAIPQPVTWIQLLYRTRTQLGDPTVTVSTILNPPAPLPIKRVVSYQSFYDSLTTRCEPSYMLNGGPPNSLWTSEENFYQTLLLQGYTVVTSDFEGQDPTFGTGPVYGYQTLDGIRAAYNSVDVGLPDGTKVAMAGYSGGAIATEWATELAPDYAPDVNANLVGSAMGGVFVHPIHNLHYVDGAPGSWSSVMPLALIGISKAFNIDLTPYLSTFGTQVIDTVKHDCIGEHSYPSLTFASLVKPEYAKPEWLPFLVNTANELIMGTGGTPTVPLFIREGTDGSSEGTEPSPQYGPGDGVMLVKDVRSLARKYCAAGRPIDYLEKPLGHGDQGADFLAEMMPWVALRFTPTPPLDTCALIQEGNSLAPTELEPGPTDVFRFWSSRFNNAHFYTASKTEADHIKDTDSNWTYEGVAFKAVPASSGSCPADLSKVFRFFSSKFQSHFYTATASEADGLKDDPNWSSEGVAYCASDTAVAGTTALYRFWSPVFGKHFYTASKTEADHIKASDPNWNDEGVAYYVVPNSG